MKAIILKGGLGNQLFQFCKYLELKRIYNEEIYIDSFSGFFLDFKYKRNLEIKKLIKNNKNINKSLVLINIFLILLNKKLPFIKNKLHTIILDDENFNLKINKNKKFFNYQIVDGYFQDFKIVEKNIDLLTHTIKKYFNQKAPIKFEKVYKKIQVEKNPVAICFRSYEDSKDPLLHSYQRRVLTIKDYNNIIRKIENSIINPHFFIFSQKNNKFIKNLNFKYPNTTIIGNEGYDSSWFTLKAQALCKHQVLNNSTFYYWGLIFSELFYKKQINSRLIYVTDNFINQNIYNPKWLKF